MRVAPQPPASAMASEPLGGFRTKVVAFLRDQVHDLRRGGLRVLLRRSRTLLGFLLALPLVLLIRLLRPVIVIRLAQLGSTRIGHLAGYTEVYLCECDAGLHGRGAIDIFYHGSPVCNQQLKKMWERVLYITRWARPVDRLNRWLPGGSAHMVPWRDLGDRDLHGLLAETQPHLAFTAAEERSGTEALRKLGIPEGAPFVCFHTRDRAYLNSAYPPSLHLRESDYWSYLDYRNSDIRNYVPAMEWLTSRGYYAVRLGASVEQPLRTRDRRIIDYAMTSRSDFMDIYLCAYCRFFLGDTSGIGTVPMIFRKPRSFVNFVALEEVCSWGPQDLIIPKKLWLRRERRLLTFREQITTGVGRYVSAHQYAASGIELIENTADEIAAVAVEMDERLRGTWRGTEEDAELQRRFWALLRGSEMHGIIRASIGAEFLRQNRALLE